MSAAAVGIGALQVTGAGLAPLLAGSVHRLKAQLQGRRGPSLVQPYRDLRRLWGKSGVAPTGVSPLYALAPPFVVASTFLALLLVPVAGKAAGWGVGHDALLLLGLLALGRFALALAAWDTGSGFALMGASRDLAIAVFAEAVLLLALLLVMLDAHPGSDLVAMAAAGSRPSAWGDPAHWCAALAFALVALAEAGRLPVDNPDTHLELTMIHEGPLLEYAGRYLAFLQWAAAVRHWLVLVLAAQIFVLHAHSVWVQLAVLPVVLVVLCGALALTETLTAKMRILLAPRLLALGGIAALLGVATWLVQLT
jgi:formate hydrogenlyase subunit 4